MMNRAEIDAYIELLPGNEPYTELAEPMKQRMAFGAWEMLRRRYGAAVITSEMAALQALYMAEGEGEEFAKFRRQGVKSLGLDGMSLSFDHTILLSPEVIAIVEALDEADPDTEAGSMIFGSWF